MSVAAKTKENAASETREHKFLGENRGTCGSKNFDETVRLKSEKREEWIREVRGVRQQGTAVGTICPLRLASSSTASFPGTNECPGTHWSLIVEEEKEESQRD